MTAPHEAQAAAGTSASRRASTSASASAAATPAASSPVPTHEDIAVRAYYLWRESGRDDPVSNWLEAEQQLLAEVQPSRATTDERMQARPAVSGR
ncbi:MAG TPA: DUF2934 domain-containing protein [Gemmatimonadaceae bacterium]